jgi:hypothetical protein
MKISEWLAKWDVNSSQKLPLFLSDNPQSICKSWQSARFCDRTKLKNRWEVFGLTRFRMMGKILGQQAQKV